MKRIAKTILTASVCVGLTACALPQMQNGRLLVPNGNLLVEKESVVIRAAYEAVDFMIDQDRQTLSPQVAPRSNRGVLVSTIVDINDLERSNALGRLLSEQIASRFAQYGVPVNELKLRGNLYVSKSQGELLLSREVRELSAMQNADLVVTGTYAESNDSVYVTVKLIRASDSRISTAFNFNLAKTQAVMGLLRDTSR
jgi:TolB-like protein